MQTIGRNWLSSYSNKNQNFSRNPKFHKAVEDKVVLDLKYEARDVPQRLTSPKAIDAWFEQKTKG